MRQGRGVLVLLVALMALVVQAALARPGLADDKTYHWEFMHVDIAVQPNGDLEIVETHRYVFTSGTFTEAYREIPLGRVESIDQVWVEEDGRRYGPERVQVRESGGHLSITWRYPPTSSAARTFRIHYVVHGALRIYEGGDQLWWKAVFAERDFDVHSARVTVRLPSPVAPDALRIASYGVPAESGFADPQAIVFTAGRVRSGQELEVRVQLPHGLVEADPPAWQAAFDRQAAYDENVRPLVTVLVWVFGLFVLVAGALGVLLLWYQRGRERTVGLVAEYYSEPPSNLPPGLAGLLVDQSAEMRDVVATIVDLARRGVVEIAEQQEPGFMGIGTKRDFLFRRLDGPGQLNSYEAETMRQFFGHLSERRLSDLRERFYSALPGIRRRMYAEAVAGGLFERSPEAVRNTYLAVGGGLLVVGFVGAFMGLAVLEEYTGAGYCPMAAVAVVGALVMLASRFMPRRTIKGAEEAARWQAFRRYLSDIEKYTNVAEAKDIFERYLPYAIAFGLDREWIRRFAAVDAPAPRWYRPYPPILIGGGRGSGSAWPDLGSGGPTPSLQGMSDGLAGSLQGMSDGLAAMLNSASSTLSSQPSSKGSGGGWSGGGGRGGGGGGGGRGGAR